MCLRHSHGRAGQEAERVNLDLRGVEAGKGHLRQGL